MVDWYNSDTETHPLVKCALFAYDCVSIHPFQDGNGRLSRLISSLLLLKQGYKWIQYVSFEHEIESRKSEYYRVLHGCQANRPIEDVSAVRDDATRPASLSPAYVCLGCHNNDPNDDIFDMTLETAVSMAKDMHK